jgi:hypothetical protein
MAVDPRRGAFRNHRRRHCALGRLLAVYRERYHSSAGSSVRPAVQIRTFSKTYFPPGGIAEGIRFLRHKHPADSPIITVEKLIVQGSIAGMLTSPKRLSAVRVVGMRMVIPPKTPDEAQAIVPLNSGPGGKALAISEITADGVMLEFLSEDRGRKSYLLKIDRLGITDVGSGTRMSYRATLTNTEPPGVIQSEGKFGPWNPYDVGATPVSGSFTYDNIGSGHFQKHLTHGPCARTVLRSPGAGPDPRQH